MPSVLGVRPALADEPEETDNDLDDVSFGTVSGRSLLLPKSASETQATPRRSGAKPVSVPAKLSINRSGSPSSNDGYHSPSHKSNSLSSPSGPSVSAVAATVASLTRYGTETATAEGVILPAVPSSFGARVAHVFARIAAHAPKELLIMRHSYRLFLLGAFFQYVHSVAHNLAYFLHIPKQPLFDIGFAVLPAMSTPVQIVSEIAFFIIVVLTILYALAPFYHDNIAAVQTTLLVGAASRSRSHRSRRSRPRNRSSHSQQHQVSNIESRRIPSAATGTGAGAASTADVSDQRVDDLERGLSALPASDAALLANIAEDLATDGSAASGLPGSASLPAALALSPAHYTTPSYAPTSSSTVTATGAAAGGAGGSNALAPPGAPTMPLASPDSTAPAPGSVSATTGNAATKAGKGAAPTVTVIPYPSPPLSTTTTASGTSSALTYNRAFMALLLETSRRGARGCPEASALAASPTSSSAAVAAAAAASAARWDGYVTWTGAHTPAYTVNMLARFFAVLVMSQAVRITCFLVTALPGPNYHCHPFSPHYDPPTTFLEVLFRSDAFFSCGDLVFSSHTTFIVLCALSYQKYGRMGWLKVAFWAVVGVFGLLVISAHKHYSLDIVVALYTVPLIWYAYDIYCPDLVPEELVAWEVQQAKVMNQRIADVVG